MPEHIFDDTHAEVADFLIQKPGNFRFSTSIESDALTLSFHATPFSPLTNSDENHSLPSLSYSLIQWDDLSDDPDGPNIVDANGLVPAAVSQFRARSQDSVGKVSTDHLSKDHFPNGSRADDFEGVDLTAGEGEFLHNSDWVQQLTKSMPIIHHPPHGTKSWGNAILPNGTHYPGHALLPNVTQPLGDTILPNGTHFSGHALSPNVTQSLGNTILPNGIHYSGHALSPNATQSLGNAILPNNTQTSGTSMTNVPNTHLTNAIATPYTYNILPVLSAPNEPCSDCNPTFGLDLDPNLHTDSLIPHIDTIQDNVRVRDFAQEGHQAQEVKTEPELEEGEIIQGHQAYVPEDGHIESNDVCDALTMLISRAAQDEHVGPFINYHSHLSTACTPPYASPIISSPSAYSID
ncbi:hypothetical protein EV702DRAFT_1199772 [Suillus placidus]|uniref:Uncharacterized protein n=1 Tax=Suillus placidus TaxID=48579 RepID=A0A9P7D0V9_9AGAM|nr:hypothetical protein EV702DRAFT_1199772 [Suillus placidus]